MAAGICPGSDGEISVAVGDLADFIGRLTIENNRTVCPGTAHGWCSNGALLTM